jgi:membrane associated rhomboid family serine protease
MESQNEPPIVFRLMDYWQNMQQRPGARQLWQNLKARPVLFYLLAVNIGLFLVVQSVNLVLYLGNLSPFAEGSSIPVISWWLGMHASLNELYAKPWGIITYAFLHEDLLHLLFNLVMLYFGAGIFLLLMNSRRLLTTYIIGAISGAAVFMVALYIFPRFEPIREHAVLIGASASALAVFFAAATKAPNMQIHLFLFGRIKLLYIALIFIAIDLISIDDGNPGGHLAHLGGALWGFLSVRLGDLKTMNLTGSVNRMFRKRRPGPRLVDPSRGRPLNDDEYNLRKKQREQRLDEILDKLKVRGYEGLTREEKDFLNSIR